MGQDRLNSLTLLSIEHEQLKKLNFTSVMNRFAALKAMKRPSFWFTIEYHFFLCFVFCIVLCLFPLLFHVKLLIMCYLIESTPLYFEFMHIIDLTVLTMLTYKPLILNILISMWDALINMIESWLLSITLTVVYQLPLECYESRKLLLSLGPAQYTRPRAPHSLNPPLVASGESMFKFLSTARYT